MTDQEKGWGGVLRRAGLLKILMPKNWEKRSHREGNVTGFPTDPPRDLLQSIGTIQKESVRRNDLSQPRE